MKAIFKHEFSSYFSGITGYVFAAFLLFFAGIYTMVYNLANAFANFAYVPTSMAFVYIIIVPVLTMRVLAEEKRQKTDQLLYSLPISMSQVVLGKFLAMLAVLAIPVVVVGCYPIILSAFGDVYLPSAYGALMGFFLLGMALLSMGMFISSLTESQAVAAGVCFAAMLLNYFVASLASFVPSTAFASFVAFTVLIILIGLLFCFMTKSSFASIVLGVALEAILVVLYLAKKILFFGAFPAVMKQLSLFERFYTFTYGVFDWSAVVYLISVTALFLFLSVQSMEKRRWSE